MGHNASLDFLNMIKEASSDNCNTSHKTKAISGSANTSHKAKSISGSANTSHKTKAISGTANTSHKAKANSGTANTSHKTSTVYGNANTGLKTSTISGNCNSGQKETIIANNISSAGILHNNPDSNSLKRNISRHSTQNTFAVIDTETNWYNEVMSIGIALADNSTFKCIGAKYYIIDPEYRKGGMYSEVLNIAKSIPKVVTSRQEAMDDIRKYLRSNGANSLYAYNAKFDYGHLEELSEFEWFDIMRLAAYKQFNSFIPVGAEVCKSGRLKKGYSVESILRMISGNVSYCETHNAVIDAMDELKIMELLGHNLDAYECARL